MSKNNAKDECVELKNIKYKSMLLNGMNSQLSLHETVSSNNISMLDTFLENEKLKNKIENWAKLDNPVKIKKFLDFSEKYKNENNITDEEKDNLILFLKDCLMRKKLQKTKEVIYDKNTGEIKEIVGLSINPSTKKFTIRNISTKAVSTLKMLTPKKNVTKTTTIKNVNGNRSNISSNLPKESCSNDDNNNLVDIEEEEKLQY